MKSQLQVMVVVAAMGSARPSHAEKRGWQLLGEGGWASFEQPGASGAAALGVRLRKGLSESLDLDWVSILTRYSVIDSETAKTTSFDLVLTSVGISYHLDELVVLPFLAVGPELRALRDEEDTELSPTFRLSIGVDWDVAAPWVLGLAAHFHYEPDDFPKSTTLVTMVSAGIHLDPPSYAR